MIRITDLVFYEHTMNTPEQFESWAPENSAEFEEWIKVLVGLKDGEGHWFQIHVCAYASMSNIKEKIYLFPIPYWQSVDSLIEKLNQFILDTLPENLNLDDENDYGIAMQNLSRYWGWEYGDYK